MSRLQSVNKIRGMVIRASKEVGERGRNGDETEKTSGNPINKPCTCV